MAQLAGFLKTAKNTSLSSTAHHTPRLAYLIVTLSQDLVIFTQRNQKNDGGDALKAVDPLAPFRSLASNVHHPVQQKQISQRPEYALVLPRKSVLWVPR